MSVLTRLVRFGRATHYFYVNDSCLSYWNLFSLNLGLRNIGDYRLPTEVLSPSSFLGLSPLFVIVLTRKRLKTNNVRQSFTSETVLIVDAVDTTYSPTPSPFILLELKLVYEHFYQMSTFFHIFIYLIKYTKIGAEWENWTPAQTLAMSCSATKPIPH